MSRDNTDAIYEMTAAHDALKAAIDKFEVGQGEDSDEGNAQNIEDAYKHLDYTLASIEALIP